LDRLGCTGLGKGEISVTKNFRAERMQEKEGEHGNVEGVGLINFGRKKGAGRIVE